MSDMRQRRLLGDVALVLGALALLPSCQRKAPGPDECRAFALRSYGLSPEDEIAQRGSLDDVDELTTECLVTPYDRELLACVERGGAARQCLREFSARHVDVARGTSLRPGRRRHHDPQPHVESP
jgi:hypothetical protein